MTPYDLLVEEMANRINELQKQHQIVFFWTAAEAMRLHAVNPNITPGESVIVDFSIEVIKQIIFHPDAADNRERAAAVNALLDQPLPDCDITMMHAWMCLDGAAGVLSRPDHSPGLLVDSVLQPAVSAVSERLFDAYQIGGGPSAETQTLQILEDSEVKLAIAYCDWAISHLSSQQFDESLVLSLQRRAAAVVPTHNDVEPSLDNRRHP